MKREEALKITALAANLLFVHGQMNSSSKLTARPLHE
jgi:hypothetical protein